MATLKKPKVTRIKRDYPEFRDRLRDTIAERDLTQTKAAEMVGMDIRTFNHVVSGPTHPDLMLLKDIGSKFDVNLNYLFGLSDRKQRHPKTSASTTTGFSTGLRWKRGRIPKTN